MVQGDLGDFLEEAYLRSALKVKMGIYEHEGQGKRGKSKKQQVQFSSVAQSCPTLCDSMNCSTPGLRTRLQYFCLELPWMEEPGRLQYMGSLELDMTERLHLHF